MPVIFDVNGIQGKINLAQYDKKLNRTERHFSGKEFYMRQYSKHELSIFD